MEVPQPSPLSVQTRLENAVGRVAVEFNVDLGAEFIGEVDDGTPLWIGPEDDRRALMPVQWRALATETGD